MGWGASNVTSPVGKIRCRLRSQTALLPARGSSRYAPPRCQHRDSSVLTHASKLQGKLMLVHGLIDENVHFRHTARLINALIAARKPYDLLIFPDERHSPRKLQVRCRVASCARMHDLFAPALYSLVYCSVEFGCVCCVYATDMEEIVFGAVFGDPLLCLRSEGICSWM